MRKVIGLWLLALSLIIAQSVAISVSYAADQQATPKASWRQKVQSLNCPGNQYCRGDCRGFGGGGNQLCFIFCKANGQNTGQQCQTSLGCPLPC